MNNKINKKPILYYRKIPLSQNEYHQFSRGSPYIVSKEENYVALIGKDKDMYYILYFSTYCKIVKKIVELETNKVNILVEINNGIKCVEIPFQGEIFSKTGVKTMLDYGLRYFEQQIDVFINYLLWSESSAEVLYLYKTLGWQKIDNELCFKGNKLLARKETRSNYIYVGSMDITSNGNFTEWTDMIKTQIIGNSVMEFVLVAALSSPILAFLNATRDLGSIVLNFANTSSTGKTSACIMAASIFGNPQLNKGCMFSFNATQNALIEQVATANGFSVCIEESAINLVSDLQKALYTLCSGVSKSRLSGDSTLKDTKSFNSVIFCSSEFNFIHDNSPDGIKARVFEISEKLTRSAENSDLIKSVFLSNYGFAGTIFIKYLIKIGQTKIEEDYENLKYALIKQNEEITDKSYENDMKQSCYNQHLRLNERILSKLAIFLQAAIYSNKIFDFKIDLKNITTYIYKLLKSVESQTTPEEHILDVVYDDILLNLKRYQFDYSFIVDVFGKKFANTRTNETVFPNSCVGLLRCTDNNDMFEVCICKMHFENLMYQNGIIDFRKRLKNLRKAGLLKAEPDRLVSRERIINLIESKVYKILLKKKNN